MKLRMRVNAASPMGGCYEGETATVGQHCTVDQARDWISKGLAIPVEVTVRLNNDIPEELLQGIPGRARDWSDAKPGSVATLTNEWACATALDLCKKGYAVCLDLTP
jgi:hypothetical protein